MSEKLKFCWKCGENGVGVDDTGHTPGNLAAATHVACVSLACMPMEEFYTIEDWQKHPRWDGENIFDMSYLYEWLSR